MTPKEWSSLDWKGLLEQAMSSDAAVSERARRELDDRAPKTPEQWSDSEHKALLVHAQSKSPAVREAAWNELTKRLERMVRGNANNLPGLESTDLRETIARRVLDSFERTFRKFESDQEAMAFLKTILRHRVADELRTKDKSPLNMAKNVFGESDSLTMEILSRAVGPQVTKKDRLLARSKLRFLRTSVLYRPIVDYERRLRKGASVAELAAEQGIRPPALEARMSRLRGEAREDLKRIREGEAEA